MAGKLTGRKVLVTQADDYMGPQSVETFRQAGAEVIDDRTDLTEPGAARRVAAAAGHLDVLILPTWRPRTITALPSPIWMTGPGPPCSISWFIPCTAWSGPWRR